jgi:hypothetical protein
MKTVYIPKSSLKKPVEVIWMDAAARGGWQSVKSAKKETLSVIREVGFLIKVAKKRIVIVQTISDADPHYIGKVNGISIIPLVGIKSIRRLK